MAGTPLYGSGPDPYGGAVSHTATASPRQGQSHMAFLFWLVVLGVVLPVAILGGLKVGGFSFVFRGR